MRDAEALARSGRPSRKPKRPAKASADMAALQEKLRSALGTKVDLVKSRRGGRLTIHFYSEEEFDSLVGRLLSS